MYDPIHTIGGLVPPTLYKRQKIDKWMDLRHTSDRHIRNVKRPVLGDKTEDHIDVNAIRHVFGLYYFYSIISL